MTCCVSGMGPSINPEILDRSQLPIRLERSLKHLSLPVHLHFRDVAVDSHQRFRQGVEKGCAAVEPLFSERCRFQVAAEPRCDPGTV